MRLLAITELTSISAGTTPAGGTTGTSTASAGPTGSTAVCGPGSHPDVKWSQTVTYGSASGKGGTTGASVSAGGAVKSVTTTGSATCVPDKPAASSGTRSTSPGGSRPRSSGSGGSKPPAASPTCYDPDPTAYDDYC
ncbi:MAG: hypothetical protein ACJ8HJ_08575 [Massilia sp.]|jgi:hypothetical protein